MGERAPGVRLTTDEWASAGTTPRARSQTLRGEVAIVREELDVLLAELDRRRRDLLNIRLQLRRHAVGTAVTALALVGAAAGAVWLSVWHQRRQQRLSAHANRLREGISRMTEHPEGVTAAPTMAGKILTAAASAAVASLVRKGLGRLLEPQRDIGPGPEPGGHEKGRKVA
jgi:hypothetical protein